MISIPFGWIPTAVAASAPSDAATAPAEETCAENVARVQAANTPPNPTYTCPWCFRGASSAPCICKTPCDASDCEALNGSPAWKGPQLWKEVYGVPKFK